MIPDTEVPIEEQDEAFSIPEGAVTRSKARKLADAVRSLLGNTRIKEDQITQPAFTILSSSSS